MLAGLFGKKCDHPMADVKSAQQLLDDLPKHDAIKSVTELTEWLESVSAHEEFKLADQYAVLSLLDETAQVYARKLAYEYFTLHDMNVFHANRLYMVLEAFARQTTNAYHGVFMRYCQADKGANSIKSHLPQLVARAIHASRDQLKYAAVRYAVHDESAWHRLAQFYQHAEQQHYLETPVPLYSAVTASVKSELGQLMAWSACALDSLAPQAIHLTERLISQFASVDEIRADLSEQAQLGFDPVNALAIVRQDLAVNQRHGVHYLYLPEMQVKLEALNKTLDKHVMPQELNLGGAFPVERVKAASLHILKQLFGKPMRQSPRRPFNASVKAVTGYDNVLMCCQRADKVATGMQLSLENASSGGFLAVLPAQGGSDTQVGNLLGIQTDGLARLGVSITRRLLRDAQGGLHLGAEMLATRVSEVILRGAGEGEQHALWLHTKASDPNGEVRLLMPADTFSLQRSLKTVLEGKNYLLIPVALQENGADYDLACFRLIEQEDALE
jgi:hypothetical protein